VPPTGRMDNQGVTSSAAPGQYGALSGAEQFTVAVTTTSDTAVRWSLSPAAGSVNPSRLGSTRPGPRAEVVETATVSFRIEDALKGSFEY
jgi:hypothetical protein